MLGKRLISSSTQSDGQIQYSNDPPWTKPVLKWGIHQNVVKPTVCGCWNFCTGIFVLEFGWSGATETPDFVRSVQEIATIRLALSAGKV